VDTTQTGAGFHTIVLHPVFDAQLGSVSFDYDSTYGPIHSDWKIAGNAATWHVTLPANTTGWLPLSADEAAKYKLNGAALASSKLAQTTTQNGQQGYEIASGSYTFTVGLQ
jgi:alpha-L-rhamnosidase